MQTQLKGTTVTSSNKGRCLLRTFILEITQRSGFSLIYSVGMLMGSAILEFLPQCLWSQMTLCKYISASALFSSLDSMKYEQHQLIRHNNQYCSLLISSRMTSCLLWTCFFINQEIHVFSPSHPVESNHAAANVLPPQPSAVTIQSFT